MPQEIPQAVLEKYRKQAFEYAARAVKVNADGNGITEEKPPVEQINTAGQPENEEKKEIKEEIAPEKADPAEQPELLSEGETVEPEENPDFYAEDYAQFLKEHPARGGLKIQLTAARGTFPVKGADIEVSVLLNSGKKVIFSNTTDNSGIADNMPLPALPSDFSQTAATAPGSGTEYKISIFCPGFRQLDDVGVSVFDSVKTILPLELEPIAPDSEKGDI